MIFGHAFILLLNVWLVLPMDKEFMAGGILICLSCCNGVLA